MPASPRPIYLDYAATTPVDPLVLEAMLPYFSEHFGNAASRNHPYGWVAAEAVSMAREQVAALLDVEPQEVLFTSGATESLNLALKGTASRYRESKNHIITCVTEHRAVLDPCLRLEKEGWDITRLGVSAEGLLDLDQLSRAIRTDTLLICLMWGNNETGVLHPVDQLSALARERGLLFCCDATQAAGKIPISLHSGGPDLLAFSAHKIGGPKGCGALFVRRCNPRVQLDPILDGGGHERGFRSGTLNVPGIVGLGKAAELALSRLPESPARIASLRDQLEQTLMQKAGAMRNGSPQLRLPHITNLQFPGRKAESLLAAHSAQLAASTASACSSASLEPSHVLLAMGLDRSAADASLRLSLGPQTTPVEVKWVGEVLG